MRTRAFGRDIRRPSCKRLPETANVRLEQTWFDTGVRSLPCTVEGKAVGTASSILPGSLSLFFCHVPPLLFSQDDVALEPN